VTSPFPDSIPLAAADLEAEPAWPVLPEGWKFAGVTEPVTWYGTPGGRCGNPCRVYWGSHGCDLQRGHPGSWRAHSCDCCDCERHPDLDSGCVARYPYYGRLTRFYGEDVSAAERAWSLLVASWRRPRRWRMLDNLTRQIANLRAIPHGGPIPHRRRRS
jgi:hypothetical protein